MQLNKLALQFFRAKYFNAEFWGFFFKNLTISESENTDKIFFYSLFTTYTYFLEDMDAQVKNLFEENYQKFD
jgi:hypothetical protein